MAGPVPWYRDPTALVPAALAVALVVGRTAWLTGAVLALHGMMQHYGHEARSYALATLAATVAAWCAVDAVERGAPRRWCWFGAAVAVGVYLHLSVLVVAIGVIGGLLATTPERRWVRPALLALGGAAVVTIPVTDYLVGGGSRARDDQMGLGVASGRRRRYG